MYNRLLSTPQDHIAIMSTSPPYITWILDGKKTIESRFYVNRTAPWDKVFHNDMIYFKESGGEVVAKARAKDVQQYSNLNEEKFNEIVAKYGDEMMLQDITYSDYYKKKNYVILITLENPQKIESFDIDKSGFGNAAGWLVVDDIESVKI